MKLHIYVVIFIFYCIFKYIWFVYRVDIPLIYGGPVFNTGILKIKIKNYFYFEGKMQDDLKLDFLE